MRVYRSYDGGLTFPTRLELTYGGKGRVGQGAAGSRTPSWISARVRVNVDNQAPYLIHLAITAVVDGVESAPVATNLSFSYFPAFRRYASPAAARTANGLAAPQSLAGTWTITGGAGLSITHAGKKFTGNLTVPNGGRAVTTSMDGTVQNTANGVIYRFSATMNLQSGPLPGTGQMIVRDGTVSGSIRMVSDGRSYDVPLKFRIEGSTLVDLGR